MVSKIEENRARRKIARMGYRLIKSRRRDQDAYDYGGYMIVNESNHVVANNGSENAHMMSFSDVLEWIESQREGGQ